MPVVEGDHANGDGLLRSIASAIARSSEGKLVASTYHPILNIIEHATRPRNVQKQDA
jgi:hypothetical protein